MAYSYWHRVKIDSRDVDALGVCKASALLGHLQEAATQAAEQGDFGRKLMLESYNGFWMLTRMWYQLNRPLHWDEELSIHTWHRGGKSAVSYRDYDMYVGDELVGEGVAAWVMADQDSRKLIRLSQVHEMQETDGGMLCKSITLSKLRQPEVLSHIESRLMRYSDTDINGHVNNTRYADFSCDALQLDQMDKGTYLSSLQIGYLAECHPGEVLSIESGPKEKECYVRGVDKTGKARFEALLGFSETK